MTVSNIGSFSFPGILYPRSCDYTRTLGTTPDVAIIECLPQSSDIPENGTLLLNFGVDALAIPNCHVDKGNSSITTRGSVVRLRIIDRRWKWKNAYIYGRYNVRNPDGSIDSSTEKTPRELAGLLFEAMGELTYDVSEMPNSDRPEVNWEADSAADELGKLCDSRGCAPGLSLQQDKAFVAKLGSGAVLPTNADSRTLAWSVDPPELPWKIAVHTHPLIHQKRLLLVAVGLDNDGSIKLINDLSYTPASGWASEPLSMSNVSDDTDRSLALLSVFKWYMVDPSQSFAIPGHQLIPTSLNHILPIHDYKVTPFTDIDSKIRAVPATVEGVYYREGDMDFLANTNAGTAYRGRFSIDKEQGIVKFPEPVYAISGGSRSAATLYLETSYAVEGTQYGVGGNDGQKARVGVERVVGNSSNGIHVIRREDIFPYIKATYTSGSPTVATGSSSNFTTVIDECNHHIDAALAEFSTKVSTSVEYRGLEAIDVDGAIRQVRFRWSHQDGFRTWGYRNNDSDPYVLDYHERRRIELSRSGLWRGVQKSRLKRRMRDRGLDR